MSHQFKKEEFTHFTTDREGAKCLQITEESREQLSHRAKIHRI